jgi:hypothetical protein
LTLRFDIRYPRLIAALCAIFPTAVFCLRWWTCLPFSGKMPGIQNQDQLSVWGIYSLYSREPFTMPLGAVNGLSFPFNGQDEMLSRGSVPLFAVPFKALAKFHAYFDGFYYLTLAEILSVFVCGYLACRILSLFRVTGFGMCLLAATLVGLSPVFLYRSSIFYNFSTLALYPLCFLMFAYHFGRITQRPSGRTAVWLVSVFVCAGLIHYYVFFALVVAGGGCSGVLLLSGFLNRSVENGRRIRYAVGAMVLGPLVASAALFYLGNEGTLEMPSTVSPWQSRYELEWGYGGGHGGGFHCSDFLSPIVPPLLSIGMDSWMACGPTAILAAIGFPVTTANLQPGQYEGFAYVGTVPILIGLVLLAHRARNASFRFGIGLRLGDLIKHPERHSFLVLCIGGAAVALFSLSWGYILHVGGYRVPLVMTPSHMLASIYPKFMLARALGRLAIPFSLFLTMGSMVLLGRYLKTTGCQPLRAVLICVFAAGIHVGEVRGYLIAPAETFQGNQIASVIGREDADRARAFVVGTRAILLLPDLRHSTEWGLVGYSLGYHTRLPLSGPTVAFGESPSDMKVFSRDIQDALGGNLSVLFDRYGPITIAGPKSEMTAIVKIADMPVSRTDLSDVDLALLR